MTRFESMERVSQHRGERSDCTVLALAAATGMTYSQAHEIMKREGGRKRRRGVRVDVWLPVYKDYLTLEASDYYSSFRTAITLTRAFNEGPSDSVYLVRFTRHVAVWRDGAWVDWINGTRRKRVKAVWRVTQ